MGIASQQRKNIATKKEFSVLFADYYAELPTKQDSVALVSELIKQHKRIALTCFESEADCCHRMQITNYLDFNNTEHL